jgi:hypothetical protein
VKVLVPEETKARFDKEEIELIVVDTPEAVKQYNELLKEKKVIGAFHLM